MTALVFPPERTASGNKVIVSFHEGYAVPVELDGEPKYLGNNMAGYGFEVEINGETHIYVIPFANVAYVRESEPRGGNTRPSPFGLVTPNGVPPDVLDKMLRGGPLGGQR